ncbi:hypothetical protein P8C59_009158 [Phyllachora maydis]|uniref:CHCH domain-containing protein n=1 Tax=Phyllachora maydis TaxID=1825666 RepID=A0AAD9IC20_9PEZI|nr:hypothetical protein P8C59_009158 [Phyllachora maydis]
MPRQRSSAPSRSAARPSVPARAAPSPTQQQQTRPAATYAAPTAQAPHAPGAPTASQGPGLFGQMASTAAGVAVGSSIGHAIGGFFGGGSAPAAPAEQQVQAAGQTAPMANQSWGNNCQGATQQFTKCMDEQGGNMQVCGWYLDQLKACQQAASQYTS